ncbi:hypothetical protein DYST_00621 [Dyella terrae]|nr:hypothetical protein DYST_00621 [Dyella terrae]
MFVLEARPCLEAPQFATSALGFGRLPWLNVIGRYVRTMDSLCKGPVP